MAVNWRLAWGDDISMRKNREFLMGHSGKGRNPIKGAKKSQNLNFFEGTWCLGGFKVHLGASE